MSSREKEASAVRTHLPASSEPIGRTPRVISSQEGGGRRPCPQCPARSAIRRETTGRSFLAPASAQQPLQTTPDQEPRSLPSASLQVHHHQGRFALCAKRASQNPEHDGNLFSHHAPLGRRTRGPGVPCATTKSSPHPSLRGPSCFRNTSRLILEKIVRLCPLRAATRRHNMKAGDCCGARSTRCSQLMKPLRQFCLGLGPHAGCHSASVLCKQ